MTHPDILSLRPDR